MVNIVVTCPAILKRFLNKFECVFTKKLSSVFQCYICCLFLELKRTNMQSMSEKCPNVSYNRFQYFLSDSKWDYEELNDKRIKIIESNRSTKSRKSGIMVIDDSGCEKWGMKTEGVQFQHLGSSNNIDKMTRCNVFVSSAYCDEKKRFPINFKPYIPKNEFDLKEDDPEFKSKIELAKELIHDAIAKHINFSDIIMDNWYFAKELVECIDKLHRTWISEAEVDRRISYHGKWVRADELVKLIPSIKFNKKVTLSHSQQKKKKRIFYFHAFKTKIKDIKGNVIVVVSLGKWDENDPKRVHVFVTNHCSLSGEDVIRKYALRWGIECMFRDLKENVAFDHYQVKTIKRIMRHWHLASLAYTFLYWVKWSGGFSKWVEQETCKTIGDCLNVFRKINSYHCCQWIIQNKEKFHHYLNIQPLHTRGISI